MSAVAVVVAAAISGGYATTNTQSQTHTHTHTQTRTHTHRDNKLIYKTVIKSQPLTSLSVAGDLVYKFCCSRRDMCCVCVVPRARVRVTFMCVFVCVCCIAGVCGGALRSSRRTSDTGELVATRRMCVRSLLRYIAYSLHRFLHQTRDDDVYTIRYMHTYVYTFMYTYYSGIYGLDRCMIYTVYI